MIGKRVKVIQIAFLDNGYAHVNSETKINELRALIGQTKKLLFIGCSRGGHAALWIASQTWPNISVSAIAICPQADYDDGLIKKITEIHPEETGGNLLVLSITNRARIFYSDHWVDKIHAEKLKSKWSDIRYVPHSHFKMLPQASNPHWLGSYLMNTKWFADELLEFAEAG